MPHLKGQLLIAASVLGDPNFARTIILMVQHGDDGALGLVLNHALDTTVKQACESALEIICDIESPLYQGGPVEGPLMVLHSEEAASGIEVFPGLFFTTEKEKIEWLMKDNITPAKYFVGYSGWSAGQLETELECGSWLVTAANADHVFRDIDDKQWSKIITDLTVGKWMDPKRIPDDPSVN